MIHSIFDKNYAKFAICIFMVGGICVSAGAVQIAGSTVTLMHTSAPAQGSCPNGAYALSVSDTAYKNMLFVHGMTSCPSGYVSVDFDGVTVGSSDTFTHNSTSNVNCTRPGYYDIPSLQTTTYSKYVNNGCSDGTGYTYRPDNPVDIIPAFDGLVAGTAVTTCDDGYLKNGTCVSYTHIGYQANYHDSELNENTFAKYENNTCPSGYVQQSVSYSDMAVCVAVGTLINLRWDGVDVTGTLAESCSYGDILYAPTSAPASPSGYKFLGWRPAQN